MTYRLEGNDPTRTHEYQSPDEVKAMITGGGSTPDYGEAYPPTATPPPPDGDDDEVMVWLTGERTLDESRILAYHEGRCPTCGRKSDCCCQGCPTCPQTRMADGKISEAWAKIQVGLGDRDPQEQI